MVVFLGAAKTSSVRPPGQLGRRSVVLVWRQRVPLGRVSRQYNGWWNDLHVAVAM